MESPLDPRPLLALNVHAQPGVYALLVGSGVSTSAGIPTGWGVVAELVRRVATAAGGDTVDDTFDPEAWWNEHGDGTSLGYSGLLSLVAPSSAARQAVLREFFEADDDIANGRKVPGPAHVAIAGLVARGAIRVILTTNFDRLIEQALAAVGVFPQVVDSAAAAAGMEPLTHARCTLVKLHGDYLSLQQLNTVEELSVYSPEMSAVLERVLDEYGLVINGWSGEWDHALVAAIQRTSARRYPMFWAARGSLSAAAKQLVAQHSARVIGDAPADAFFPDLLGRLDALDDLADAPLSVATAVAQLKRILADPTRHIQVRDLFDAQLGRIRAHLESRPTQPHQSDAESVAAAHDGLRRECDLLLNLLASGAYLDRARQHTDTWIWVVEQLMRARRQHGSIGGWWDNLQHYPALLALRTGCAGALAAGHEDVVVRLLRDPSTPDPFQRGRRISAVEALQSWTVLDADALRLFETSRWSYPHSHLLRETLAPVLAPIVGDRTSYDELSSRVEFRIALAEATLVPGVRPVPGEFMGDFTWAGGVDSDQLIWQVDFIEHGDHDPWQLGDEANKAAVLKGLSDHLRQFRRW